MSYFIFVVYTLFHRIQIEDFCLAGAIIHCWLPQVFRLAFGHMEFREFQEADQNADPRIVETLSWHAINGKRLKSSLVFWNAMMQDGLSNCCLSPWRLHGYSSGFG